MGGGSLSGWLALAAPLALYAATLSPGVDFWDIGEMQTVPYLLGIAHPTGFPLAILAGWLFTHLFAVGDPAWRMSLFSAMGTSLAARALYAFVSDATDDAVVALASALAFAVGEIVWTRAVRADVHDLALGAIAIGLALAARAGATRDARMFSWSALAFGCALAIHPIAALALPCALVFAWPALRASNVVALARTAALGLVPLSCYLYIPLRSAYVESHGGDPGRELGLVGSAIFDSGAPSSPAAFAAYVTGAEFSPLHAFAKAASVSGVERTLLFAREVAYRNDGVVMLAFALVGFGVFLATKPRLGIGLATLPLLTLAFVANYAAESEIARYALPALWALGACAGVGTWWLARAMLGEASRARALAPVVAALALGLALAPSVVVAARAVGATERSDDARTLGPIVARYTLDGSLVVASWNYATPLAYDAYVLDSLGSRRLAIGWPHDFVGRYQGWHAHFHHVYFVLARGYDVTAFARPIVALGRWQLSELRS